MEMTNNKLSPAKSGLAIRILYVAATVVLMAMTAVIVGNILGRVLFKTPIFGAIEIAGLTGAIVVSISVILAERARRNIVVDVVATRFPSRMRAICDGITRLLTAGTLLILFWAMFKFALDSLLGGEYTGTLGISPSPFQFIWAFGLLALCGYVVWHMVEAFRKAGKK
jgi:TRAP-type C4-dicarboxylate transport system permease small subunit